MKRGGQTVLVATETQVHKLLGDLGIGAGSTVVVYDDWGAIFATRLWWVLKYYGFNNVKVLDGGWQNWVSSGLPVSFAASKPAQIKEPASLCANPQVMVTMDELLQKYKDPAWQVLDVRSVNEFEGRAPRQQENGACAGRFTSEVEPDA